MRRHKQVTDGYSARHGDIPRSEKRASSDRYITLLSAELSALGHVRRPPVPRIRSI